MKLLSLFGLDRRVRSLRIAAGEGAIAAEDRVQLVRMAWESEKNRLKLMFVLVIAVLGLTTVAVGMLSVAVVVQFWDTPNRATAAWSVAALWIGLWVVAVLALMKTLNGAKNEFEAARSEFARDWAWARHRFGVGHDDHGQGGEGKGEGEDETARPARPATQEELLARIALQRERIAVLEAPSPGGAVPTDETASAAAMRIVRQHPVASGVAAVTVVAVLGPRRLLRWAAFIVPALWRMR